MLAHAAIVSAIADKSSIFDKGRAKMTRGAIATDMASKTWRDRIQEQLDRTGMSMREASLAAGLSAGYLHGIMKDGKEPTIDRLGAIARALNVSLPFILIGVHISPETEQIIRLMESDPDRRDAILRLLPIDRQA